MPKQTADVSGQCVERVIEPLPIAGCQLACNIAYEYKKGETSVHHRHELMINLPRERVLEVFLDADNRAKWQPSLLTMEPIKGDGREVGAQTKQLHSMGGRELWITETITVSDYPNKFCATYEGGGTHNLVENYFSEVGENKTKWVLVSDFSRSNLLMRTVASIMPGTFKDQSLTFMKLFKEFVERAPTQ